MEQKHGNGKKVRLMCSYGGKIQSRPTDHQLSYVGGDTKIVVVDRAVKFTELVAKLNSLSNKNDGGEITVKYQLPGEALDSLVSLIDDEDVEHMIVEYDRMQGIASKTRLRIFVFNISGPASKPVASQPVSNPDYLFGFDKEYQPRDGPPVDLLPIPSNILTEKSGRRHTAQAVVYQVPVVGSEGLYGSAACYPYGNREQPVYGIVPVTPPVPEQRMMMVSMGNDGIVWR